MSERLVSIGVEFNAISEKLESDIFLKMHKTAVSGGLIAALGGTSWTTLCVIASYMDEQGRCYPTQDQIATGLGVSRQTANRYIKELLDFRWKGQSLIERTKMRHVGQFDNSVYTIKPISQLSIFDGKVESLTMSQSESDHVANQAPTMSQDVDTKKNQKTRTIKQEKDTTLKTGKDVVTLFCKKYRETYDVNYTPNFARDVSMVKNKLISNYSMSQIEDMVGLVFREYDNRWAKANYPRPTIGQLCTWLANEAMTLIDKERVEQQQAEILMSTAEQEADDFDAVMARLGGVRS